MALVLIVLTVFILGALLISDSMIPTYTGDGIINEDTNAFTIVKIDNSNHSVSIYGKHSVFTLSKLAQAQYSNESFYLADKSGIPQITTNVTLECTLKASFLNTAAITLSVLLSDTERDELDIVQVYRHIAMGNTTTIDQELILTGSTQYSLQKGQLVGQKF